MWLIKRLFNFYNGTDVLNESNFIHSKNSGFSMESNKSSLKVSLNQIAAIRCNLMSLKFSAELKSSLAFPQRMLTRL
jgi:hypothetical protein